MRKLWIYARYLFEYLKFGDFQSIFSSVRYLTSKKSHKSDRTIRTSMGTFFCRKNTNDFQFANLMYEWSVKDFIFKNLNGYNVFIDAGACVGDYVVLLSKHNMRCFSFEPIPENYAVMLRNFELNRLGDKVKSFPFGLGESNRSERFIFNPVNTGASHIDLNNREGSCPAEIRTLDSLSKEIEIELHEKILIKLDAEGMEPEALKGAGEFLVKYPEITLIIEDKFTERGQIQTILDQYAVFEYGTVDKFNMYARKIRNHT
jgi:FkbM family methyltransferase